MDEKLFEELLESVRQAGAILRGEMAPARITTAAELGVDDVEVRSVRERLNLSRPQFAQLLGVPLRTLEGWEQRRRSPDGAARVLLRVVARYPEQVLEAVASIPTEERTAKLSGARGGNHRAKNAKGRPRKKRGRPRAQTS